MKLIKSLDSRLESATAKPNQTKRFGLFECPVCKEHVEKPLTQGRRNKTCGKQECRKAAGKWNTGASNLGYKGKSLNIDGKDTQLKNLEFVPQLRRLHTSLLQYPGLLDDSVNRFTDFCALVYVEYENMKLAFPDQSIIVAPKTKFETIGNKTGYTIMLKQHHYGYTQKEINVSTIAIECHIPKSRVIKLLEDASIDVVSNLNEARKHIISTQKTHNKNTDWVYLIKGGPYYKIGVADEIEKRVKQLDTANPYILEVVWSLRAGVYAFTVEKYLHNKYKTQCVKGEWFDLTDEHIAEITHTNLSDETLINMIKLNSSLKREVIRTTQKFTNADHLTTRQQIRENTRTKSKETYQKQLEKNRKANEKPEIEVVVDEDREEYVHDRSAQIEATTKHGMSGTPIYKEWRRLANHKIEEEWKNSAVFIPSMVDEFSSFDGRPRIVAKVDGLIGPNNYKIVDVSEIPVASVRLKGITQLCLDGNEIARFDSAAEAARHVEGVTAGKIPAVCKGTRKSHAGYKWKYTE